MCSSCSRVVRPLAVGVAAERAREEQWPKTGRCKLDKNVCGFSAANLPEAQLLLNELLERGIETTLRNVQLQGALGELPANINLVAFSVRTTFRPLAQQ